MAGLSRQLCALSHPKKAAETQTAEPGGAHAVCSRHPVRVKGLEGSEMESARENIDLQPGSSDPRRSQPINLNHYATKKSVAESMLDVALFMSNAMRLKAVLEQGPSSHYYTTLVTLISLSLLLQVVIGVLLVVIARLNLNEVEKQWRLNQLNNAATILVFFTVVINVFITAFGAHKTGFLAARASRNPL
ncbi:ninjurin-2 isoform X1 [Pongo pygmaeus]|uniref:NINJ2 isoform 1 n=2 Tax=Hominidae TaxID=9604 RepID=H2NG27_PONAB|nr:ninjurin-2 isoform X1 [Gorilla gorilla gorilla]XP_054298594.1 ninjurin-2 isoform X1 [Pongo pygmaeus]PNJ15417.1 NINJ2 isoform 1 [Pongo abelii]